MDSTGDCSIVGLKGVAQEATQSRAVYVIVNQTSGKDMSDADLVRIATYINKCEAELGQSVLKAAGIPELIKSDDCGGLRPHLWTGGITLSVRAEDAARAAKPITSIAARTSGPRSWRSCTAMGSSCAARPASGCTPGRR
jgi:hypothetical protein